MFSLSCPIRSTMLMVSVAYFAAPRCRTRARQSRRSKRTPACGSARRRLDSHSRIGGVKNARSTSSSKKGRSLWYSITRQTGNPSAAHATGPVATRPQVDRRRWCSDAVGLSYDDSKVLKTFSDRMKIGFPLLSDPGARRSRRTTSATRLLGARRGYWQRGYFHSRSRRRNPCETFPGRVPHTTIRRMHHQGFKDSQMTEGRDLRDFAHRGIPGRFTRPADLRARTASERERRRCSTPRSMFLSSE